MQSLPIDAHLPRIADVLRAHSSLVLIAAPGAGKTTRVPPAIIASGVLPPGGPNLIMLQPRRVAARAAAERMAVENSWQLGGQVGYHIRFEKRYGLRTRIRVLTEAILTRILLEDPYLDSIGAILLDEFHERNIHTDLALAFLREIQQTVRPDLKLIVMSATLDAGPISHFLSDAPIIEVEGRTFPVDVAYRFARERRLEDQLPAVLQEALDRPDSGDILVFLPGVGEIERATRALASAPNPAIDKLVLPLHGSLSSDEQQRALGAAPPHVRKIILATNIAETSLTIDGVRTVIDSGLARVASFDADRGMDRLDLVRISQASATQRAGRAGRQAPGRAYRLWPEIEQKHLPLFNTAEIHRVDLAPALLALHAWTAAPSTFQWFDRPMADRIEAGEALLHRLGALQNHALTPLGRLMLRFPLHPRLARLLVTARSTRHESAALSLAATLSDDARPAANPLHARLTPQAERTRHQLAGLLHKGDAPAAMQGHPVAIEDPADLLLLAYPDRVARRRENDPLAAVMVGGAGLRLAPEALTAAVAATPLLIALDPHHDPRNRKAEATVRTAIPTDEQALGRLFPEQLRTDIALEFDAARQKVVAITRRRFDDLLLHEDPHGVVDRAKSGAVLAEALTPRVRELFLGDPACENLLARNALLRHHVPDRPWPVFDDGHLAALLAEVCAGKRSLAEVTDSGALADSLRGAFPFPLDRQRDQLAPETLEVPSGSHIRIDYAIPPAAGAAPPTPILAVRLQELFGLLDTPRIAGGRVPLLLHLLSPGYKPIQITQDLRSFWSGAYFEVRKDLRTRYPKHKWPDDPLTAPPEAKGRRR